MALSAFAQPDMDESHAHQHDPEKLGTVLFPTSCAPADPLFARYPNHPGLAHYLIHACDTPQLAPLGSNAARRYAAIAPSSAHALHMPSHIFARLGMWQEDIQSNLASIAATRHTVHEPQTSTVSTYHR